MRFRTILFFILLILANSVYSQNWDIIRTSGEYYYGIGVGSTEVEADQAALSELTSQIATHVSSDFMQIDDITTKNGTVDHKNKVLNCVKTYSQSTLTNTEKWVLGKEPNITVRRYLKRTELTRIFENRIVKAKDMINIADDCLGKGKVDMALQYYYWAYSLIRSVQFPNEVRDEKGNILVNRLPIKIDEILSNIKVKIEKRDGDYVDVFFTYKNKPVSSLEFSYSDGRTDCQGFAKDGRGMMEMSPGYQTPVYHINIEYEYKGQARGDVEMESVLGVIAKKTFVKSELDVLGKTPDSFVSLENSNIAKNNKTLQLEDADKYMGVLQKVMDAVRTKKYSSASSCFTIDGLEMYNKLISYGSARIVGNPVVRLLRSSNGNVVARGVQMSFSFRAGKKKTYVEDVVFTFNKNLKIDNVAFGLGKIAEDDIMNRQATWKTENREMLLEFLENYKTAYCLQRTDYISQIFADDATIIIGHVAKKHSITNPSNERAISLEGQNVITYNRYTKDQYIKKLQRCFARNEFVNIRFTNSDIQWLEKYEKEDIFAIQLGQEYNSSTYADKGYLFLLLDMTNHDEPLIRIRTWQPNEVSMDKLYNAGDFYNE